MKMDKLMSFLVRDQRIKGDFPSPTSTLLRVETGEKVDYIGPSEDVVYFEKEGVVYFNVPYFKVSYPTKTILKATHLMLESDDNLPFYIKGEKGYFRLCIYVDPVGPFTGFYIPKGYTYRHSWNWDKQYPYFEWPNL